jgi:two-component system, cell cycle response regulator
LDDKTQKDKTSVIESKTLNVKLQEAKKNKPFLRQMTGTFIGRKYPLNADSTIVGRDPGIAITVQDKSVSRQHAEIVFKAEDGSIEVVDMNSTNGTFINDIKIKTGLAHHGDIIRFGNIMFKYFSEGDIESVYQDELADLAHLDGLTGIYNRKYMLDYLETELKRCTQLDLDICMIMFDLDHFKKVNDTYGHLAGDYVLKEVVKIIKESGLRQSDVFGRYGGEEFCIIVSETPLKTAVSIAERLRAKVEKYQFNFEGKELKVTISLGVAPRTEKITTGKELIGAADDLLYKAKEGGRNKACYQ